MHRGNGQRRRQAKAVAISQTGEALRHAAMLRAAMALGGAVAAIEAALLIGKVLASYA